MNAVNTNQALVYRRCETARSHIRSIPFYYIQSKDWPSWKVPFRDFIRIGVRIGKEMSTMKIGAVTHMWQSSIMTSLQERWRDFANRKSVRTVHKKSQYPSTKGNLTSKLSPHFIFYRSEQDDTPAAFEWHESQIKETHTAEHRNKQSDEETWITNKKCRRHSEDIRGKPRNMLTCQWAKTTLEPFETMIRDVLTLLELPYQLSIKRLFKKSNWGKYSPVSYSQEVDLLMSFRLLHFAAQCLRDLHSE